MKTLPPQAPPPEESSYTAQVLRLIKGGGHGSSHDSGSHEGEEEEKIEVDERWLMTYADKMTILCGLFIMLFAMSKMDEGKLQKIKESTEKSFGKPDAPVALEQIDPKEFHEAKAQIEQLKKEIDTVVRERQELEVKLSGAMRTIAAIPAPPAPPPPPPPSLAPQLEEAVKARQVLEEKLKTLEDKVTQTKSENSKLKDKLEVVPEKKNEVAVLKKQLTVAQTTIETLKEEIEKTTKQMASGSFMAFVMSWDTESHDADLRIEEPGGKTFDFKNRQYKNTPGRFVIDTRRGPGTEVWQSDQAVPGKYKFTYEFYNSYGNKAPCVITGTLFTQKGSIDMPKVELDIAGKKKMTFVVSVDEQGHAKVLH